MQSTLILFLLLTSAAKPVPICNTPTTVVVDFDAPPFYDRIAIDSIQYWNAVVGYDVLVYGGRRALPSRFSAGVGSRHTIGVRTLSVEARSDPYWRAKWFGYAKRTRLVKAGGTWVCTLGTLIWLDEQKGLTIRQTAKLLAHEMGHALGLDHVDGRDWIMFAHSLDMPDAPVLASPETQTLLMEWYTR